MPRTQATFPRLRPALPIDASRQTISTVSAETLAGFLGLEVPSTVSVTPDNVRGLPAAWRAVNLIANGVASMTPPRTYDADEITQVDSPPVVARPLATMTAFDFWHMAVAVAVMRGNFV